jgi:hypothetical protein
MSALPQFSATAYPGFYGGSPKSSNPAEMRHKTILLVFAALSVMVAAYGASAIPLVPTPQEATPEVVAETQIRVIQALNIMDDARLRYTCIIGAVGGACISIAMFSTPRFRPMAGKFTVAAISGSMLTPAIMRFCNIALDTDWIIGSAFVVAVCAYSVLQAIVPLVPRALAWAFRTKYLPPEEDPNP